MHLTMHINKLEKTPKDKNIKPSNKLILQSQSSNTRYFLRDIFILKCSDITIDINT